MSPILDRFRTQPRHRHPDPIVRLAFVQELPIDEHDLLSEIAKGDEDARVRRAAAAKLMQPRTLAEIVRDDADESVRGQAAAMLRDIALEAFESVGESESLAAVDAITDARLLATVAKTAPREVTAAQAATRVTDVHALGAIARQSVHESVRRGAFTRLDDRQELLAVALNSEYRDPAVDAVDRFDDRATLDQIAARAKNRSVSKRARHLVREIDERAAVAAGEQAAAEEGARVQAAAAAAAREAEDAAARAAALERSRADEAARTRAEEDEAAARRQAEHDAAEQTRRDAEAETARQEAARRRGRLLELVVAAETAAGETDLGVARRRLAMARHQWKDTATGAPPDLAARFAAADARIGLRDAAAQEQERRTRQQALERLLHLAARVEPLVARTDLTLKAAERALRDLRTSLAAIPPLPSRRDYEGIVHRLKATQAALIPKVQELRDVADWQRWANVGIQEQLCEKMEALKALDDPEAIARQVRDLQQHWRQAADVPRAQGEALWRRFKAAHDEVWAKCEAHFAAQAEARSGNLTKKLALAERAEALADSTQWIQTADEIKKLQAEWKTIGPVSRGQEKVVWDRFRTACDRFFTRRHADLAERKAVWAQNFARKEALCVRAEALAESTDWENAAAEIRRLQAEWKTIGPVKKTRAEAIWQRFRAACDAFFARYAQRHEIARGERVAAREAIVAELEAMAVVSPQSSGVSQESPVVRQEAPVARQESPVARQESPVARQESPVARQESPVVSQESPVATQESPVARQESPVASQESRVARQESPVASQESSELIRQTTDDIGPKIDDSGPKADDSGPKADDSGPKTDDSGPKTEDSGLATDDRRLTTPEPPVDLVARVRALRGRWQQELALRGVDRERAAALDERYAAAFAKVIAAWPAVFGGTDLDPDANRKRMEGLVTRMEDLATSLAGPAGAASEEAMSPTTRLAAMLKEALASNTIGGKVDDSIRFRAAIDEMRQAQSAWSRIGPVPEPARRALTDRFQKALRRISERASGSGGSGRPGGTGRPGGFSR